MNIYVTPNNQKLLWKTISRSPLFTNKQGKDNWFKNIIGQFYENNKTNTTITLKEINIHTINYMIKSLQEENQNAKNIVYPITNNITFPPVNNTEYPSNQFISSTPINNSLSTQPITQQDFHNARQNEFNTKLQEMENQQRELLQKKAPQEIDFRDKVEDAPIANIGELMKMEIEKRNRDIQQFVMSRTGGTAISTPIQTQQSIQFPSVNENNTETHKHVTWKENIVEQSNDAELFTWIKINMEKMMNQIDKLTSEVDFIRTLLEKYPELEKIYNQSLNIPEQQSPLYEIHMNTEKLETIDENINENVEDIENQTEQQIDVLEETTHTVKEIIDIIENSQLEKEQEQVKEETAQKNKKRRRPTKKQN